MGVYGLWIVTGGGDPSGNILVSNDGSVWTPVRAFIGGESTNAAYANGTWVVTGKEDTNGNNIWFSKNGYNWNPVLAFSGGESRNVLYANETWVVTGYSPNGNNIWFSKDGSGWHPVYSFVGGDSNNVSYANGTCVVAGKNTTNGNNICFSKDGSGWHHVNAFAGGGSTNAVYENGTWVVTGYGDFNNKNIWFSKDGSGWHPVNAFAGGGSTNAVYTNGKWIVTGKDTNWNNLWISTDCSGWSPVQVFLQGESTNAVYANGTWVITGKDDINGNNLWFSKDGSGWHPVHAFVGGVSKNAVYENGTWVVTGYGDSNGNNLWFSKDGSGWHPVHAFGGDRYGYNSGIPGYGSTKAVYASGTWVVSGYGNNNRDNILVSTDGSGWSPIESFILGNSTDVFYADGTWVVIGERSTDTNDQNLEKNFYFSKNGSEWFSINTFGTGDGQGVVNNAYYEGGSWVITGYSANGNNLLVSTDGSGWNPIQSFIGGFSMNALFTPLTPPPSPPCFVKGTRILTPTGYKQIEELNSGDYVLTAAKRKVKIHLYSFTIEKTTKDNAPYRIPAGALGNHLPKNDICVSPRHAVKDWKGRWQIPKFLGKTAIQYGIGESVTYYHIECPDYYRDNLLVEGAEVESFKNKQGPPGVLYIWDKEQLCWNRLLPHNVKSVPANPTSWVIYSC